MVAQEPIPDEKLLAEISRLADELEKVPSFQDMNQHGTYSAPPYIRAFGSWNKAVEAAGYSSRASRDHHTREALLAEITHGYTDGQGTILRYGNENETVGRHECHTVDDVTKIEFPGIMPLRDRFIEEIKHQP
jgi:hypothetical protein